MTPYSGAAGFSNIQTNAHVIQMYKKWIYLLLCKDYAWEGYKKEEDI